MYYFIPLGIITKAVGSRFRFMWTSPFADSDFFNIRQNRKLMQYESGNMNNKIGNSGRRDGSDQVITRRFGTQKNGYKMDFSWRKIKNIEPSSRTLKLARFCSKSSALVGNSIFFSKTNKYPTVFCRVVVAFDLFFCKIMFINTLLSWI